MMTRPESDLALRPVRI